MGAGAELKKVIWPQTYAVFKRTRGVKVAWRGFGRQACLNTTAAEIKLMLLWTQVLDV